MTEQLGTIEIDGGVVPLYGEPPKRAEEGEPVTVEERLYREVLSGLTGDS